MKNMDNQSDNSNSTHRGATSSTSSRENAEANDKAKETGSSEGTSAFFNGTHVNGNHVNSNHVNSNHAIPYRKTLVAWGLWQRFKYEAFIALTLVLVPRFFLRQGIVVDVLLIIMMAVAAYFAWIRQKHLDQSYFAGRALFWRLMLLVCTVTVGLMSYQLLSL